VSVGDSPTTFFFPRLSERAFQSQIENRKSQMN
jgi:hypothetical protein